MTDEIEVYAPGQAPVLVGELIVEPVVARMCIGGPVDGKVLRARGRRLDYRKPSITVRDDLETGQRDVEVDVRPLTTYLSRTIRTIAVLGRDRRYRCWVDEVMLSTLSSQALEREVIFRLIDANPADVWAVREL